MWLGKAARRVINRRLPAARGRGGGGFDLGHGGEVLRVERAQVTLDPGEEQPLLAVGAELLDRLFAGPFVLLVDEPVARDLQPRAVAATLAVDVDRTLGFRHGRQK